MLTAAEVAARLRVAVSSAYELMHKMAHVKLGGRLRVTRGELERYITSCTVQPAAAWAPPVAAPPPARLAPGRSGTGASSKPIVPRTKPRPRAA